MEAIAAQRPSMVRADWEGLIGEYGWDHNTLYIYEEEGALMALIEWFYTYPLREINKNEFVFPDEGFTTENDSFFVERAKAKQSRSSRPRSISRVERSALSME